MATHLEQRRRAIADALRAVMAEPLPRQRTLPLHQPRVVAQPPIDGPAGQQGRTGASAESLTVRAALAAHIDGDDDDIDELNGELETPAVPPVQVGGSMSRAASMALFGHA